MEFQHIEKLSESRITTVFKTYQPSLDRVVLLKILQPHLRNEKELAARFQREAQACAKIRHENIVDVYEFVSEKETHYIVMEFVEGDTLENFLAMKKTLSPSEADKIITDCLRALAAAHKKGVIHRDVKPANIMIDQSMKAKLTDFGLAHIEGGSSLTQESTVLGTPAYISPEQLNGEPLDGRADLFSLGAVYYEMLSGQVLFAGKTFAESFSKVMTLPAPQLPNFSDETNLFLRKLLAKLPGERFKSADEALAFFYDKLGSQEKVIQSDYKHEKNLKFLKPWLRYSLYAFIIIAFAVGIFFISQDNRFFARNDEPVWPTKLNEKPKLNKPLATETNISNPSQVLATDENHFIEDDQILLDSIALTDNQDLKPIDNVTTRPDSGYLMITCQPWADILINERRVATTPFARPVTLSNGTYKIKFENPAFPTIEKQETIIGGELTQINFDFWRHVGFLSLHAAPWAEVYIDKQKIGTTPIGKTILQSTGWHHLDFVHPSYPPQSESVNIIAGDTTRVTCQMGSEIMVQYLPSKPGNVH